VEADLPLKVKYNEVVIYGLLDGRNIVAPPSLHTFFEKSKDDNSFRRRMSLYFFSIAVTYN
jgi:hypothetical protein